MINARTADEQRTTGALIAQKRGDLASSLQQLQKLDGGQPASKLLSLCQRLDANLAALEDITTERGAVRSQITALNDALYGTNTRLAERVAQLPDSRAALEVAANGHFLVNVIGEASLMREPAQFKHIQDSLKTASDQLRASAAALADPDINSIAAQLAPLATGPNSIFARHAREMFPYAHVVRVFCPGVTALPNVAGRTDRTANSLVQAMQMRTASPRPLVAHPRAAVPA